MSRSRRRKRGCSHRGLGDVEGAVPVPRRAVSATAAARLPPARRQNLVCITWRSRAGARRPPAISFRSSAGGSGNRRDQLGEHRDRRAHPAQADPHPVNTAAGSRRHTWGCYAAICRAAHGDRSERVRRADVVREFRAARGWVACRFRAACGSIEGSRNLRAARALSWRGAIADANSDLSTTRRMMSRSRRALSPATTLADHSDLRHRSFWPPDLLGVQHPDDQARLSTCNGYPISFATAKASAIPTNAPRAARRRIPVRRPDRARSGWRYRGTT